MNQWNLNFKQIVNKMAIKLAIICFTIGLQLKACI